MILFTDYHEMLIEPYLNLKKYDVARTLCLAYAYLSENEQHLIAVDHFYKYSILSENLLIDIENEAFKNYVTQNKIELQQHEIDLLQTCLNIYKIKGEDDAVNYFYVKTKNMLSKDCRNLFLKFIDLLKEDNLI